MSPAGRTRNGISEEAFEALARSLASVFSRSTLACACLLLCFSPWVGAAHGDGLGDLRAGIRAYDEGDLHRAAPILRAATKAALAPRERARAWLYLGLTIASLEGIEAARAAFRAGLHEDAELAVDRERVPPKVAAALESVRQTVTGELTIGCDEPGTRVFLGGRELGRAPLVLRLPVGRHSVRLLSTDSHRAHAQDVVVSARTPARVFARLQPRLGKLRLKLRPDSARAFEGQRLLATIPNAQLALAAGAHHLVVRAHGHEETARDVLVEPDMAMELAVTLRRAKPPWYERRRAWGWASLGLAAATTAAGVVAGLAARSAADALAAGERDQTLTSRRHADLTASVDSRSLAANVLYSLGAASAVTGLVLLLVGDKAPTDAPARSWRIVPGAGAVWLIAHY